MTNNLEPVASPTHVIIRVIEDRGEYAADERRRAAMLEAGYSQADVDELFDAAVEGALAILHVDESDTE